VLHTWGQNLHHHPHIHCVVPGGGISLDRSHWISCRNNFFLPVRVLSRLFRGKFLAFLREAHEQGQLSFFGTCAHLREPSAFQRFAKQLKKSEWVVYSKPPFGGPEQVLKYISRYTHRFAISNSRLLSLDEGQVSFHWRDYRDDQIKVMTISAVEFLRRFLQHVLPPGFVKIRHFGWLANRCRKVNVAECRRLLSTVAITTAAAEPVPDHVCPLCHIGVLRIVGWLAVVVLAPSHTSTTDPAGQFVMRFSHLFARCGPYSPSREGESYKCVHDACSSASLQAICCYSLFVTSIPTANRPGHHCPSTFSQNPLHSIP
jgi:hypothetical protein